MIYLFWGEDRAAKEKRIIEIKKKNLTSADALKFDYDLHHGLKLDPVVLKKTLLSLPAISKRRLILIRAVEKLSTQNKKIILDFIQTKSRYAVLILDLDEALPKNNFFNKVTKVAEAVCFGRGVPKENVFDMTRAMEGRDSSGALKILNQLLNEGNHPLQIMGGLVWFWGKSKNRLSGDQFKKGLQVLQEADLNIKRSRLKPEHAVEIAVTKMSLLLI